MITSNGKPVQALSKTRLELIEACGRICQVFGLPRSLGQIYGLLYLAPEPLSLESIADLLGISKASARGDVYNLTDVAKIAGTYVAGEAGIALAGGVGAFAHLTPLRRGGVDRVVDADLQIHGCFRRRDDTLAMKVEAPERLRAEPSAIAPPYMRSTPQFTYCSMSRQARCANRRPP